MTGHLVTVDRIDTPSYPEGGYIEIWSLNRPNRLNALNRDMHEELIGLCERAESDDSTRVILIAGTQPEKNADRPKPVAFAAGADIKEMNNKEYIDHLKNDFIKPWERLSKFKKPIIAGVAGYALGGGCEIAMMCDIIIAAENAKFGQPEINLGVMAGFGGTQLLSKFVGKAKSMEMHLTGRHMDAVEAERAGLVSRIVPTDDLIKEAKATALKIAEKSMLSCLAIKESVNH